MKRRLTILAVLCLLIAALAVSVNANAVSEDLSGDRDAVILDAAPLNGLVQVKGVWGYYKNNVLQTNYTGLVKHTNGIWYYVHNGTINWNYTGVTTYNGATYYVQKGRLVWGVNGLVSAGGNWYYLKNSVVQTGYTGLVKHTSGAWYFVEKGIINWNYTGITTYNGATYYVQKGRLVWGVKGLVSAGGKWYYLNNSVVQNGYTGLVKHTNGRWYYVQKGQISFGYTGLVKHTTGTWYYVQKGSINWDYTGLTQYSGKWYYIQKGTLIWGYNGIVKHTNDKLYYVSNSAIDWTYNGTVTFNDVNYNVVSGVAQPVEVMSLYIPVIAKGQKHQFWQAVKAGAEQAAADLGVQTYFWGPASELEVAAQVEMVRSELAKNPAALALAALYTDAYDEILADCVQKGIPVIGFDSGVPDDTSGAVKATVAMNNENAAVIAAEKLGENADLIAAMEAATSEDPVVIACLSQDAVSSSVSGRTTGFVNKMVEIASQYGTVSVEGHSKWENIVEDASIIIRVQIATTPMIEDIQDSANVLLADESVAAIFCSNEGAVVGFLAATNDGQDLADGGAHEDLIVVGFDAGAAQKDAVRQGLFYGSVAIDSYHIGYYALELAAAAANGETVEDKDSGAQWYDSSNIDDALISMLVYD